MLKKFIYLTTILALLLTAGFLGAIAPYHIYTLTLTEGVDTQFLKMSPTKSVLYDGESVDVAQPERMDDINFYGPIHFGHFNVPIPINHPLFSLIPIIKIEAIGPRLGASFNNSKNIELFNFILERPYKFETTFGDQKIFILPIFKNYISRKNSDEVWADLFVKKISLPSNEGKSFFDSLISLKGVSYYDLVYNLYILYNRRFTVPEETQRISFFSEKNMGIVELPSDDPRVKIERLYIIEKGIIYPVLIKTRVSDINAQNFRTKFLREIAFKSTTTDSAIPIYAKYKQINYQSRLEQEGMIYLYSAWSHDLNNREFVRVIIQFLERGKLNLKYLKPFYEYAYKKFGSTLSSESGFLNETAAEALKRKTAEELEKELASESSEKSSKFEGKFSSPEEKIRYNLQKAKDQNSNSDERNQMLSIE